MKRDSVRHRFWRVARAAIFLAPVFPLLSVARAGVDTSADFLKIPIGAEPAGLGQAYTALAHGINALNWNPAGIVNLRGATQLPHPTLGLSLSHQDQFSETNLDHLGAIIPSRSGASSWGLDLIHLSYTDQDRYDDQRNKTGSLSASDLALGAAYAHNFGRMQMGTQLKVIRQELAGHEADGFAVDLGFLSATPINRMSLGMSVRNLGPQMKFVDEQYALPLTLSVGTAYRLSNPIVLLADVHHKPYSHQTELALGTQLFATNNVMLRAGYLAQLATSITNNQTSETNRGNLANVSGLTGGLGLQFRQFSLDYAITPFGELGNTQMLTLSTWFGPERKEEKISEVFDVPNDRVILILPMKEESYWDHLR